jgi:hypothetical protein
MDFWHDMFSHVCGQGRCFIVDGEALPLCQRCLGLYMGAAVTGGWLAVSGMGRRGFPGVGAVVMHSGLLLAALLGGIHVIDPGPQFRMLCGLWTGHVMVLWLSFAAQMRRGVGGRWRRGELAQVWVVPWVLAAGAMGFGFVTHGAWVWVALAVAGMGVLVAGVVRALAALGRACGWVLGNRSARRPVRMQD